MRKLLISVTIIFLLSCCSQQIKTDGSLFVVEASPPSSYPGNRIKIVVENKQEMDSVHLEYPKGTLTPMDRVDIPTWEIIFNLPRDITSKINLGIIGKPVDGSPAITQSFEYEIMENPTINAKVVSEDLNGAEVEVKTSKPFKKVYIQVDDNKQISFEREHNNTYTLKTKELDLDNKGYVVNLEDENGNTFRTYLNYTPHGVVPMMYDYRYSQDPNTFEITEYYGENSKDNPYKKLKIAQKKDLFMDSLPKGILVNSYVSPKYLSMSPSKKHLLMNTIRNIELSKNFTDSTGQILKSVKVVYSTLYNLETGKYEFIGEPYYYKEYKNPRSTLVFKEEGPLYYFMRWEGDNLYLLEQRKDPRMMYDEGEGSNVQDGQSTLATAMIVSYSMTKKTITVTNQKPVTPWLTFSDQWTGIQGWGLANEKRGMIMLGLSSPDDGYYSPNNICFIGVWGSQVIFDVNKFLPAPFDNYLLERVNISFLGLEDKMPLLIIKAIYQSLVPKVNGKYVEVGEIDYLTDIYKIFPLTKLFEKIGSTKLDPLREDFINYLNYDCLKDYCKYFTVKDGKIISKYKCDKYINPIESIRHIN